eukprot:16451250-Heterocapsa_arctica.AAC.1
MSPHVQSGAAWRPRQMEQRCGRLQKRLEPLCPRRGANCTDLLAGGPAACVAAIVLAVGCRVVTQADGAEVWASAGSGPLFGAVAVVEVAANLTVAGPVACVAAGVLVCSSSAVAIGAGSGSTAAVVARGDGAAAIRQAASLVTHGLVTVSPVGRPWQGFGLRGKIGEVAGGGASVVVARRRDGGLEVVAEGGVGDDGLGGGVE